MSFLADVSRWLQARVPKPWRKSARAAVRWILVGAFLGVGLGYLVFVSYLPSVAFPSTDRPSPVLVLSVLFAFGVLAGFLSDDVPAIVVQSFVGVAFGVTTDFLMIVSPVFHAGILAAVPSAFLPIAIRYSFPILLLSLLVWLVSGLVGLYFVDLLRRRLPASAIFPAMRENL